MNGDHNCGHCVRMRKTDGWCPMHGFVNALSVRPCFCGDDDTPPPVRKYDPRRPRRRVEPVFGAPEKEGRTYIVPAGMKYCPVCNRVLPKEDFGPHKGRPDGLGQYCRSCCRRKQAERNARKRKEETL